MTDPTPKQIAALYQLECFTAVHGRAPSWAELGRMLGVHRVVARRRMHYAEKKGLVHGRKLTEAGLVLVTPLLGG